MTAAPTLPLRDPTLNLAPARRAGNLERSGFVGRLRCECGRPDCRETFPALAESHRGHAERFIVVPAHLGAIVVLADIGNGTVVRAADEFFVVELDENAGRFPVATEPRMRLVEGNAG